MTFLPISIQPALLLDKSWSMDYVLGFEDRIAVNKTLVRRFSSYVQPDIQLTLNMKGSGRQIKLIPNTMVIAQEVLRFVNIFGENSG